MSPSPHDTLHMKLGADILGKALLMFKPRV